MAVRAVFASKGYPFHGECKFALCCMERGYTHCGECEEFPCKKLTDYAYDPEYGDENGSILKVLRQWSKEGAVRGNAVDKEEKTND